MTFCYPKESKGMKEASKTNQQYTLYEGDLTSINRADSITLNNFSACFN